MLLVLHFFYVFLFIYLRKRSRSSNFLTMFMFSVPELDLISASSPKVREERERERERVVKSEASIEENKVVSYVWSSSFLVRHFIFVFPNSKWVLVSFCLVLGKLVVLHNTVIKKKKKSLGLWNLILGFSSVNDKGESFHWHTTNFKIFLFFLFFETFEI